MKLKKILACLCLFAIISVSILCFVFFTNVPKFEKQKIEFASTSVMLFDNQNKKLKDNQQSVDFVPLNNLKNHTKDAFISIEDKTFYNHSGINLKRIAMATLKNITHFGFVEGASTISQQLIKNTHLTNQKTIKRKVNEILLTKKLEDNYSKDQILEYYLNIIYFGDNCYGIQNASKHYFNTSAKNLNLEQSALLAAMIKSPNYYKPTTQRAKNRRNLVLTEMQKDGKIGLQQMIKAKNSPVVLEINQNQENVNNLYQTQAINEACKILNMPKKQIVNGGFSIYTYYNQEKQQALQNTIKQNTPNCNFQTISLNVKNNAIEAYISKSNINMFNKKRQVGSTIKPILVYTPALEENIISPATQILDEKIDINGFSPKNHNNSYSGYVSAKTALSKSLNVPAVKILSYTGVEKSKEYAKNAGLQFDTTDNNLAIALGGMKYGCTLSQIAASYQIFANNGFFNTPSFISHITNSKGKIVYKNEQNKTKVIREDTAYLTTNMLQNCARVGTAKQFSNCKFDVASKTGTVGNVYNTDAFNIAYTPTDIVGTWLGNADNSKIDYVGSSLPTTINKTYFEIIYKNKAKTNFEKPSTVCSQKIDMLALKNKNIVCLANNFIPQKYIAEEQFSVFNLPKEQSTNYISVSSPKLYGKIVNQKAVLSFKAQDYLIYEVYKKEKNKNVLLCQISGKSGIVTQKFNINNKASYFVVTKIKNYSTGKEICSNQSNIVTLIKSSMWYS